MSALAPPRVFATSTLRITSIGEICDQFDGEVQTGPFGSQLHASDYSDEGTPVVMPQDMADGKISDVRIARVSAKHTDRLKQHQLRSGDVVFSRRGDVTRFAVVTPREQGWLCGTGSIRIRLNCQDVDIDYLRHFLKQETTGRWLLHNAKGVTMANLNTTIIRGIPFSYPPLDEQRRIAAILDKADALRRKRKRALELLDGLTQSVFASMFGDLVAAQQFPRGNIGQWVADFETGKNLAPDPDDLTPGYRVLKVSAVTSGVFDPAESKPLPANYTPPMSHLVQRGDLLFSRANTEELVGATALVERSYEKLVLPDKIWRFVWSRTNPPDPVFIRELFRSTPFRREISKRATGTSGSMKNISKEKVLQIDVGMPSREQQAAFSTIASRNDEVAAGMVDQLAKLDQQFSSLQHRAFTGQL